MKILTVLLMTCSVVSFAAGDIEAKKQKIADHIDKRIAVLQTFKTCVQASETKEAIKACKVTKKAAMKDLRKKD
jgi:hypothetical protein